MAHGGSGAPLRRNRSFRLLWIGDAASQAGSAVTYLALPLLAVVTLRASPFQVGLLTASGYVAWVLVGLPAGAALDRGRKRPVMVWCDLARAALLLSVPAAAALGALTLGQLYGIALGVGALTTVFDVAHPAYVPHIVARADLVAANSRLQLNSSVAQVGGPPLGGALVQLLSAGGAVAADAATFLVSAVCLGRIRDPEPRPTEDDDGRIAARVGRGLRFVASHPVLRAIAIASAGFNLFIAATEALSVVFLIRTVEVPAGAVGPLLAAAGAGGVVAAAAIGRLQSRIGTVRLMWMVPALTVPCGVAVPFADPGWGLSLFVIGTFVPAIGVVAFNVAVAATVQSLVPARRLARVGASIRVVTRCALPLGALASGYLATLVPVRAVLLMSALGLVLALIPLLASPIPRGNEPG